MKRYYIDENNSGGSWWLDRKAYDALFAAGWKLDEAALEEGRKYDAEIQAKYGYGGNRTDFTFNGQDPESDAVKNDTYWRRDDVAYGWRHDAVYFEAETIREAVESFEAATGQDFFAQGCNCCGVPFSMSAKDENGDRDYDDYISGSSAFVSVRAPW